MALILPGHAKKSVLQQNSETAAASIGTKIDIIITTTTILRPFFQNYPGELVPEEKLLDFMMQGKINIGRHTDHIPPLFYSPIPLLPPIPKCQSILLLLLFLFIMMFVVVVTRPLLRQIENLQSTFAAQTSSYERVEKNLTDRLSMHLSLLNIHDYD